jgi:hypothetical protein
LGSAKRARRNRSRLSCGTVDTQLGPGSAS